MLTVQDKKTCNTLLNLLKDRERVLLAVPETANDQARQDGMLLDLNDKIHQIVLSQSFKSVLATASVN